MVGSMQWENRAGIAAARTPVVDQLSIQKDVTAEGI
jgi:hypothetical protein